MGDEEKRIGCAVFQNQEKVIKILTKRINDAEEPRAKIGHAEELDKEVDVLLKCPDYKKDTLDCGNCRTVANLRKATAGLIIKAKKLI